MDSLDTKTGHNASNSPTNENARRGIGSHSAGKFGYGVKEDESNIGGVWAAGFHHVTARSILTRVLKLIKSFFFNFHLF
jgi:hypothetical protein